MKADTFIKLLRKVIREEVQAVVREELGLLLEAPDSKSVVAEAKKTTVRNSMVESIKPAKPTQPSKPMAFTNNNILNDILNETRQSSEWQSLGNMDSSMAQGFNGPMMNEVTYRFNPQDVGQPKGIGINVLFNNSTNVFNQTYTTKEQVKSNLINYILTNKGERFFDPLFGGDLRASLFDPDSTFDTVTARLEQEIYAYVPNILIHNISIKKQSDQNLVNLVLDYSINNQNDNLVINVSTTELINQ